MNKSLFFIIALIAIISIPIIYITLIPKDKVALPIEVKNPKPKPIETSANMYTNMDYGFSLMLPISWVGYTIASTTIDKGTQITLRHPLWTTASPRMDIPILIYPLATWEGWEKTGFEGYKKQPRLDRQNALEIQDMFLLLHPGIILVFYLALKK